MKKNKGIILTPIVSSEIATDIAKNRLGDMNATEVTAIALRKPAPRRVKTSFKIFNDDGSVMIQGNNVSLARIKRSSYYHTRRFVVKKRVPTFIMSTLKSKNSNDSTIGARKKRMLGLTTLARVARLAIEVVLWSIGMTGAGVAGGMILSKIDSDRQLSDLQKRQELLEHQLISACKVYNKGCILGYCWSNCGPR